MIKEAVAVYNPQDELGRTIQDAYHSVHNRFLTWAEVNAFVDSILSLDGLHTALLERIGYITRSIFENTSSTSHLYVPCHLLELRDVLRFRRKVGPHVCAFESQPALRLLQEYDTLLVVDKHKLTAPDFEVGFHVYSDVLTFDGALVRVLTRERVDSIAALETEKIVKAEYPVEVFPASEVPGIAFSKAAANLQKFIVNIPTLEINEEAHNASNAQEAVNEALYKKWRAKNMRFRNSQYTVDYWLNSGFWDEIVRPADEKFVSAMNKQAEATNLCGNVVEKRIGVGSKSERDAVVLQTSETEYTLRFSGGNPMYDEKLSKLVGRCICATGMVYGSVFVISKWNDYKGEEDTDVVKMMREEPDEMTIFHEGDRVRKRNRGISFKQINGIVNRIKDGLMFVRWDNIKDEEVFKLTDTVMLHARIEKI